ncbi:uncharacterized protein LOC133179579 [Saccostrea echinata]|uniref:uncharacterized protein LOC133179579 n=1 Tax=Saccostrea echinata TaxID=191078 RepID=UPI002A7ED58F|nr:uncharacterized protein LOC133179579 [Saccostrea echinata]
MNDTKRTCLIHKGSRHTINQCKAFKHKNLQERKKILRDHNFCLRCCDTSDHFAKNCHAKIECDLCKSTTHSSALHVENHNYQNEDANNSERKHGEEVVRARCTDICGVPNFTGKSCARIVPVRIYPHNQPENAVLSYAMLDDQSNRTLGKSSLFDHFSINFLPTEYTMESCAGKLTTTGRIVVGLIVEGIYDKVQLQLPPVLECRDLPEAHHVIEQRIGPPRSPFAQRSPLGWTIIGKVCLSGQHRPSSVATYRTCITRNGRPTGLEPCEQVVCIRKASVFKKKKHNPTQTTLNVFETTTRDNKPGLSIEDRQFSNIMDSEFQISEEGKWIAPLPFREPHDHMPDNYKLALHRAKSLDASLHKNKTKKQHFLDFMQKLFDNNHIEIARYLPPERERWYLPLFGVYHPRKPEQIRGVFDSSAKHMNVSLNDQLLQGPDLINNLLGVLIRFRKEMVDVVADVQQMFHSFLVREDHRDFRRFLWHEDNLIENPLVTYRMRAHVFGNKSSPSIAMYGLRRIGDLAAKTHGDDIKEFIKNDFYVDDGLRSCPSSQEAINLISKTQDAMKMHGGLRLHKFASNSKAVMDAFEPGDLAKGIVDMDFEKDTPTQRSLGLLWDLGSDFFKFSISTETKTTTRRGILSVINSLYDPLGFISPVTLNGKLILRKIVASTCDWDDPLPDDLLTEWNAWSRTLSKQEDLRLPRVIVPNLTASCHWKAKPASSSCTTIPRIELCSAVLAVEISQNVVDHFQTNLHNIQFFSDSKVTLGYIHNNTKRFYVYVANRVAKIRSYTEPSQWKYIRSEMNPADIGTRGIQPSNLQASAWLLGPADDGDLHRSPNTFDYNLVQPEDVEIRSHKTEVKEFVPSEGLGSKVFEKFFDWNRLITVLAAFRRKIQHYISLKRQNSSRCMSAVELLLKTEHHVIREVQSVTYSDEIRLLKNSKPLNRCSLIASLDPFIDDQGLLRVGERLTNLGSDLSLKAPIILPAKHHITLLIARKCTKRFVIRADISQKAIFVLLGFGSGTNFVGTANELKINVVNVEDGPIHDFLLQHRISWIFNPSHSSHMGGVWERMIAATRRILEAMLLQHKSCLTHEVLSTFLAEVSHIINSRPLVSVSTDPNNPMILTPSTLLAQKLGFENRILLDVDKFDRNDLLRKHWKRAQNLAAIFLKPYKVEYLNTLQDSRKWTGTEKKRLCW